MAIADAVLKPSRRWFQIFLKAQGNVNIIVVLVTPLFIAFMGLGIDVGYLVWVGQQLQTGADAAAMAAARTVRVDQEAARDAAQALALANVAIDTPITLDRNTENDATGDIVVGRFDRLTGIFNPDPSSFNAVKIVARRTEDSADGPIPLVFSRVFGFAETDISRTAIAMIGGGTKAGLIVLGGTGECALDLSGNVVLTVDGGAVQVNSSDSSAACFSGNTTLDGGSINITGDYSTTGNPDLPDELNVGAEPLPDPLAFLPAPPIGADLGAINVGGDATVTISPGYYAGGISMNNGTLNLQPGIYIVDGPGLRILGGTLNAEGVMFYITGTGIVDLGGNGTFVMSPPDPAVHSFTGAETYEGITIFQDRANTNAGTIVGTSLMELEGSYYFPNNHMSLGGDATKFGNQFIVETLEVFGNGHLTINYDGRFPAQGSTVFLVS